MLIKLARDSNSHKVDQGADQGSHIIAHTAFAYPPGGGVPVGVVVSLLGTLVPTSVPIGVLTGEPGSVATEILIGTEEACMCENNTILTCGQLHTQGK